MVGMGRFELPISCTPCMRLRPTGPHPGNTNVEPVPIMLVHQSFFNLKTER